jgi:LysM repeat protein
MRATWFGIGLVAITVSMGSVSCGESGQAVTNTTAVQLGPTNYVTIPPPVTTVIPPVTTAGPQPEQEYIIEQGDYPATIAQKFNVPLQALMELNGWTLQGQIAIGFPGVGTPIRIPSGGAVIGGETPTQTTAAAAPGVTAAPTTAAGDAPVFTAAPTTTVGEACAGQDYTITAADTSRLRVAQNFGVTVEALDAANGDTAGYSAFYPGLVIKIPGAPDC